MNFFIIRFSTLLFFVVGCTILAFEIDPKGYVAYCPCMGRFGNQMDHFLGSLGFAKDLDRTLIVPHWIEYSQGKDGSKQIPFKKYFKIEPLNAFHRVIDMDTFMEHIAPNIWPKEKRTIFCYGKRPGSNQNGCNAKDGNPFGPFWDFFNINFVNDEIFGPDLYFNTDEDYMRRKWIEKYPAKDFTVLSFTGAPATFPVKKHHVLLQKYIEFSDDITEKANKFIEDNLNRPIIGIHIRNGLDFERACEHVKNSGRNFFSSAQCLGYNGQLGTLTHELCFPSRDKILKQTQKSVERFKAKSLFVASDNDHMIGAFKRQLKSNKIKISKYSPDDYIIDLAILTLSDHFIGNCVSSFSSFPNRHRLVHNKTSEFWMFKKQPKHDEL